MNTGFTVDFLGTLKGERSISLMKSYLKPSMKGILDMFHVVCKEMVSVSGLKRCFRKIMPIFLPDFKNIHIFVS